MPLPAIVTSIILPLLMKLILSMKSELRDELVEFMQGWYKRCKASSGKVDDYADALACSLLNVDVSGVEIEPKPDTNTKPVPNDVLDVIIGGVAEVAIGTNPFAPPGNELGGA